MRRSSAGLPQRVRIHRDLRVAERSCRGMDADASRQHVTRRGQPRASCGVSRRAGSAPAVRSCRIHGPDGRDSAGHRRQPSQVLRALDPATGTRQHEPVPGRVRGRASLDEGPSSPPSDGGSSAGTGPGRTVGPHPCDCGSSLRRPWARSDGSPGGERRHSRQRLLSEDAPRKAHSERRHAPSGFEGRETARPRHGRIHGLARPTGGADCPGPNSRTKSCPL